MAISTPCLGEEEWTKRVPGVHKSAGIGGLGVFSVSFRASDALFPVVIFDTHAGIRSRDCSLFYHSLSLSLSLCCVLGLGRVLGKFLLVVLYDWVLLDSLVGSTVTE